VFLQPGLQYKLLLFLLFYNINKLIKKINKNHIIEIEGMNININCLDKKIFSYLKKTGITRLL